MLQAESSRAAGSYEKLNAQVVTALPQEQGTDPAQPQALAVDFETLREENPECVAWLRIEALDLSYPVMFGDEDKYLRTTFGGDYSRGGSLFLDTRSGLGLADRHVIIFGHNMTDGSMFGRLNAYAEADFFLENPYIYLYTPEITLKYRVFSHYLTTIEQDSYRLTFADTEEFTDYVRTLAGYSLTAAGSEPAAAAQILTLSTCVGDDYRRRVVHAMPVE